MKQSKAVDKNKQTYKQNNNKCPCPTFSIRFGHRDPLSIFVKVSGENCNFAVTFYGLKVQYHKKVLKMKNIYSLIGQSSWQISNIFLIATAKTAIECETHEN